MGSKKRVNQDELAAVEEKWNKSKAVHSIMRHVARNSHFGVEMLYERFGWPMAERYGHAYRAMQIAIEDRPRFLAEFDIPKEIHAILFENIEKRMQKQQVSIRCPIEVTCFSPLGILGIKKAFQKGLELSTDDFVVKIKLEAPPRYILTVQTLKGHLAAKEKARIDHKGSKRNHSMQMLHAPGSPVSDAQSVKSVASTQSTQSAQSAMERVDG